MSKYTDVEFYYPAFTALAYYVTVFTVGELARMVLRKALPQKSGKAEKGLAYTFCNEFIGTVQMCTCVYENGIMVQYYGVVGLFFTVAALLFSGAIWNAGAFVSPLAPIESAWYGQMSAQRLTAILSAQALGGMTASRCALAIWYYTYDYAAVHAANLHAIHQCSLNYKIAFPLVVAFEIFGCFLIRVTVANLPANHRAWAIPSLVSAMLSIALIVVGVPGLNPVVASSRMFGCQGIDHQWFIALYWICPIIGWMIGSKVAPGPSASKPSAAAKKVVKKVSNEKEKEKKKAKKKN